MINFNTDKEVLKIVKERLEKEIERLREDIKNLSEDSLGGQRETRTLLAQIYYCATHVGLNDVMNYELPKEPTEESEKVMYGHLKQYHEIHTNAKMRYEEEIAEYEKEIISHTQPPVLNEAKAMVTLYKLKCYELGYVKFYVPDAGCTHGPGSILF
ncbi:hypothetical protein CN510_16760 [Priestia megaterium]|uniref:hypothetical protein n=1 Tax=Priestia megaterium TaxID=1404 RepID=UPI000BF6E5F8|nr:hypothetical protein [Priestia megaterium]PES94699.1 hypothetical protein CN510_16760 [Priestia megaterium]